MLISGLSPLAHRVVGTLNIHPPEHEPENVRITRLFFRTMNPRTLRERFSVWDFMMYDGFLSITDIEDFEQHADHFDTRTEAVKAYNLDDFDASDWDAHDSYAH
jgi:hypothetical protein